MEFQLGRERNRVRVVGDVKIGQEPKNTLMLLLFHFLGRHLHWVHRNPHIRDHSGNGNNDGRHQIGLPRRNFSREGLLAKAFRLDCNLEGTWRHIRKRKLSGVARDELTRVRLVFRRQTYHRA